MEGPTFREKEVVVQVNYDKLVKHIPKDVICEMLEGRQGVTQLKWYNQLLKKAMPDTECGLPITSFPDPHQVISSLEFLLCEDLGRTESFKQCINKQSEVPIWNVTFFRAQ